MDGEAIDSRINIFNPFADQKNSNFTITELFLEMVFEL